MTEAWSIRPYQDGDEVGILELFNEVFAEGNATFEPRTLAHWYWQFRDNPLSHHTYVAIDDAGKLVGNYTSIPGRWFHQGEPLIGAQAVDTCVDKAYRRVLKKKGLFLGLAGAYFDHYGRPERDRIIYGFPNPIAYRIGTRQLDYRPVHTPVTALVRDFGQDWVDYLGGMGADRLEVTEVREIDPGVADLAATMNRPLELVQERSAEYLRWRYLDCPTFDYRLLEARSRDDGRLRGLLVLRTEWLDRPLAPLVDWIVPGDDQDAISALVQAAAHRVQAAGKSRMETWIPPWSSHWRTLETIGFAPDPSRFNLCIRVFGPPFDESWARDHWFFTMGDSDIY